MDEIGETEDIPETDVGAGTLGLVKTTAATIIHKTAWEQRIGCMIIQMNSHLYQVEAE